MLFYAIYKDDDYYGVICLIPGERVPSDQAKWIAACSTPYRQEEFAAVLSTLEEYRRHPFSSSPVSPKLYQKTVQQPAVA